MRRTSSRVEKGIDVEMGENLDLGAIETLCMMSMYEESLLTTNFGLSSITNCVGNIREI